MLDYKYIGQRIKAKRKEMNLTQQDISEMAKISPAYISRIEAGLQNVTLDTLVKVAKSINEDPIFLISGIKDEEENILKKLFNKVPSEFFYLFELALLELKKNGILNIEL